MSPVGVEPDLDAVRAAPLHQDRVARWARSKMRAHAHKNTNAPRRQGMCARTYRVRYRHDRRWPDRVGAWAASLRVHAAVMHVAWNTIVKTAADGSLQRR
jgi:hypothetical protein